MKIVEAPLSVSGVWILDFSLLPAAHTACHCQPHSRSPAKWADTAPHPQ